MLSCVNLFHDLFLNTFPHFFFRKRNLEERKLSHEEMRRQTAHSFTKISIPLRSKEKFLNAQFVADLYRRISKCELGCGMQNVALYLFHDFIFWPICSESESEFLDIEYLSKNVAKRKIMKQAHSK
jgi:hypothetical protein